MLGRRRHLSLTLTGSLCVFLTVIVFFWTLTTLYVTRSSSAAPAQPLGVAAGPDAALAHASTSAHVLAWGTAPLSCPVLPLCPVYVRQEKDTGNDSALTPARSPRVVLCSEFKKSNYRNDPNRFNIIARRPC